MDAVLEFQVLYDFDGDVQALKQYVMDEARRIAPDAYRDDVSCTAHPQSSMALIPSGRSPLRLKLTIRVQL